MKVLSPHAEQVIIPVMKPKKLPVLKENCEILRMPIGCNDDDMPWEREGSDLDTKYMYVCHSELNAILNSPNHDLRGSRMYVTLFPCNECAKAIIQSGIKELIYLSDKYHDTHASIASRRMFNMTGVKYRAYQPTGREIKLDV